MEKNLNFRAIAFFLAATFAVSSANATQPSFFAKHKKLIIAGTVAVLTTAATVYYFRDNLSESLFGKKEATKQTLFGRFASLFKWNSVEPKEKTDNKVVEVKENTNTNTNTENNDNANSDKK